MQEDSWFVYIIQTTSGKLYTGITKDLERRFSEHKQNTKGARFFHISPPEKIVFRRSTPSRSSATKREIQIKKMNRKAKLALLTK